MHFDMERNVHMSIMKAAGGLLTGLGCPVTFVGAAAAVLPLIQEPHLQQALRSLGTPSGQPIVDGLKKAAIYALQYKWVVLGAGAALLLLGMLLLWGHGRRMRARAREERQYRRESYRAEETARFQRQWASPYEQPAEEAFAYQEPGYDRYAPPAQPWAAEPQPQGRQTFERAPSPYARPLADEPSPVEDLQLWANQTPGFQQPAPRPKSQPYWMTMEQQERAAEPEPPVFQADPVRRDAAEPEARWSSRTVMPSQEMLFPPVAEETAEESAPTPAQPAPAPAAETAEAPLAYAPPAPVAAADPYAGQYEPNEPPEESAVTPASSRIRITMGKHRM